jgi:hypothetical protein
VRTRRQAGDLGTDVARHLDRDHADTAGRALDQHAIAGAHARHLEQRELSGEVVDGNRRALRQIDRRGELEHLVPGQGDVRRVAAEVRSRDHRIAGAQVLDRLADRDDAARHLVAGDKRLLRRVGIEPEAHLDVGEVHAGVRDIDRDFVICGLAWGQRADLEGRGGAKFLDRDLFVGHGC